MSAKKRRPALAAMASLALMTAACGGGGGRTEADGGDGTGEITVWGHQGEEPEVAALEAAVDAFNSSQDDITATLQLIPGIDYAKTLSATSPEDLPDVLEYDGPLMSSFVYDGKLTPIEDFVSPETVENQTTSATAQNTYPGDDQLYGVSQYDAGLGIYASRSTLEAAGVQYPTGWDDAWTAEEFQAALTQLAAVDPDGKVFDIKENYGGEWPTFGFLPVINSTGKLVVAEGTADGNLNSPEVVAAVQQFADWRQYVDPNSDDAAFVEGRVAISWVGHWVYNTYAEALGDDLVVLPLPDFGAGAKSGQGSWAWGVGAGTDQGAAAGEFLDFLMNDENVAAMTSGNGAPPATTTVIAQSPLYQPGGPMELFAQALSETCGTDAPNKDCVATPRPLTPAYPLISQQFSETFFNIYKGADAQAELDKAAEALDQDFEDNAGYGLE